MPSKAVYHKPSSHADCDAAMASVDRYVRREDRDPLVVSVLDRFFAAPRAAYVSSRTEFSKEHGTVGGAASALQAAVAACDEAHREWVLTVNDKGRILRKELTALAGGHTPGDVARMKPRDKCTTLARMFEALSQRPALTGDRAKLAALQHATRALLVLVEAREDASTDRTQRGDALERDRKAFDSAYMRCRNATVALFGEPAAQEIFPAFVRPVRRSGKGDGGEEGEGDEAGGAAKAGEASEAAEAAEAAEAGRAPEAAAKAGEPAEVGGTAKAGGAGEGGTP
jgi:hypothetical protein